MPKRDCNQFRTESLLVRGSLLFINHARLPQDGSIALSLAMISDPVVSPSHLFLFLPALDDLELALRLHCHGGAEIFQRLWFSERPSPRNVGLAKLCSIKSSSEAPELSFILNDF